MSLQDSHQISDVKVMLKVGADGNGIVSIEKTGTVGNVDTYTITLTNGDKYTFTVTNGGGGHEIENAIGQKLTQRDLMQFLDGLDAVDDAQGEITKVKLKTDYISLADWNAMTEEEQETYKQEHFRFGIELPDTSGVINAEYMKLLWENPDSTQSFASQNITLASADYDMLRVYYNESVGGRYNSVEFPKGVNGALTFSAIGGTNSTYIENRSFTRNSDTSYTFGSGQYTLNDGSLVTDNSVLVPIAVYGIKKNFQFKVNAIANELSTRADHCFLDDETTTVEEKLEANTFGSYVDLSTYTDTNPYVFPSDGYVAYRCADSGTTMRAVILDSVGTDNALYIQLPNGQRAGMYVRKGMKTYAGNVGSGFYRFIPLQ